jgi:hypothetical protein
MLTWKGNQAFSFNQQQDWNMFSHGLELERRME